MGAATSPIFHASSWSDAQLIAGTALPFTFMNKEDGIAQSVK
jgi:hypothetical protein